MNRLITSGLIWLILLTGAVIGSAQAGEIRGLPAGQAVYNNGYYNAAPSYAYAAPQTANYAPAYQQAYPVRQAYYPNGVAVAPAVQAGRVAYYAPPTVAFYAPASPGYAISPAGGAASYAYYGQQQPLNYAPPAYRYETRMVGVPVTYYRPVVVYQPGTGVATTCQKACTGTQCQPQRFRLFNWFGSNSCSSGSTTCNYGSCAPATATTGCGTVPYYNTVPGATAPAVVYPGTTAPRGFNNILTPRTTVPPPGTGVIGVPADQQPFIDRGTTIPSSPPATRSTVPGSVPNTIDPARPNSFGIPPSGGTSSPPSSTNIFGSNFRSDFNKPNTDMQLSRPTITEPGLKQPKISTPPSTLRPVPDPEAGQRTKPGSRAPALINPNDKTARVRANQPLGAATWAVVPARWPEKTQEVNYKVQTASAELTADREVAPLKEEKWDDSGWKSAR
ncbi:MAG: hypothetical protein ACKVP0_25480 [Pirellulaceae bacterium]